MFFPSPRTDFHFGESVSWCTDRFYFGTFGNVQFSRSGISHYFDLSFMGEVVPAAMEIGDFRPVAVGFAIVTPPLGITRIRNGKEAGAAFALMEVGFESILDPAEIFFLGFKGAVIHVPI
jgi:hypothetical protein